MEHGTNVRRLLHDSCFMLYAIMLAKIRDFVKANSSIILSVSVVVLLVLFSFALGYIIATYQQKEPIVIENQNI